MELSQKKSLKNIIYHFRQKNINLSILSPRKIPILIKIFEKADGDISSVTSKNYSKDPRHLVLLKGFSLKERAGTPAQTNIATISSVSNVNVPSVSSIPSVSNVQPNLPSNQPALSLPSPAQTQNAMIRTNSGGNLAPISVKDAPHPPTNQTQRWAVPQQQQRPNMANTDQTITNANSALISQLSAPPNNNQGFLSVNIDSYTVSCHFMHN